ncbi:MAG: hypothetical protein K6F15_02375 [Treponema sp.]|nr:hypothetical protein [Treponema sp.]
MKKLAVLFLLLLSGLCLFGQEELPSGYKGIKLGMTIDEVKEALIKDYQFGYRGDRDVSLMPDQQKVLIETDTSRTVPSSFLDKCWFQFYENKLYVITINVKQTKMDHYSIFSTLTKKYGNPDSLNPEKSEWQNDSVIFSLERPLTLKYTDKKVYDRIMDQAQVANTAQEMSAQSFLEGL